MIRIRILDEKLAIHNNIIERNKDTLSLLNEYEAKLYELLKSRLSGKRLEQEKIPQDYVNALFAANGIRKV